MRERSSFLLFFLQLSNLTYRAAKTALNIEATNVRRLTFDPAVFGPGDEVVTVDVETGDGGSVTAQQHPTHTCL